MQNNLLFIKNPEIFKQIHPFKNKEFDLKKIKLKSNKRLWWKCLKNEEHSWKSVINDRARYNKGKCPYCSRRKKEEKK
jgi:hypothetical protein